MMPSMWSSSRSTSCLQDLRVTLTVGSRWLDPPNPREVGDRLARAAQYAREAALPASFTILIRQELS
jgi:hypothetical protein